MDEQNRQTYSLSEIKDLVYGNSVDASNLGDILTSLADFEFDDEIREILDKLAGNANIPESVRKNLRSVVENYDQIIEAREERIIEESAIAEQEAQQVELAEQKAQEEAEQKAQELAEQKEREAELIEQQTQESQTESGEQSDSTNTDTSNAGEANPEENKVVDPVPIEETLLGDVTLEAIDETNQPNFEPIDINEDFYIEDTPIYGGAFTDGDLIPLTNEEALNNAVTYASSRNLKILSQDPGVLNYPEISIELTEESKPYIDNLLLSLHENKDDIDVSLTRVEATGKEMLTLKIDDPELSQYMLQQKGKEMFATVEKILRETNEEKDYEASMPDELKTLKDKFVNDDPKIPDADFKVGFAISEGEPNYYLVANNKYEAIEISKSMGYEIKEDRGGNVFELDTDGKKMEGNKLDQVTEDINMIDEVKDTRNGISDVDIDYNNKHYDNGEENYQKIEKFIEDNRDPSTMSVVQADVPTVNSDQRIVSLASSDGTRETIVFNNGEEFDRALPKIVDTYGGGENTTIAQENVTTVDYGNGKAALDALSSDNTYLRLNNFDSKTVNDANNTISKYVVTEDKINTSNMEKNNSYVKTLGTYTTNKEAANTSFLTLLVFILVLVLGIIVVYVIYGG